jgi:hypothetical protein
MGAQLTGGGKERENRKSECIERDKKEMKRDRKIKERVRIQ